MLRFKSILFASSALWSTVSFAGHHGYTNYPHTQQVHIPSMNMDIRDTDDYSDTNGNAYHRSGNYTTSSDGHGYLRNGATVQQLY